MNKIFKIIFIIFSLSLFSITDEKTEIVQIKDSHFEEVYLRGKVLGDWINSEVILPVSVLVDGDLLIVVEDDFSINDQLIKFFSIEKREKTGYYGKSGSGPGEIQGGLQVISTYGLDGTFSFLDFVRKRVSLINIDEVLAGEYYKEPVNYKVLPPDFIHMQYGTIVNDTLLIGGDSIQGGKLLFANYKSNQYNLTEFIPETNFEISSFLKPNLYMSNMAVNKKREKVVVTNKYFDQIEIYNYEGDVKMIIVGDHSDQVFNIDHRSWRSDKTIEYYDGVTTTNDYIMTIYYDKTFEELRDEQGYFRDEIKSIIRIFDWSGKPVKKINLDRRVTNIAYDEANKRIIAIDRNALETMIEFKVDL